MCKISVLVPIYNVEKYLKKCLESLAAQDMEEIEFICLNDGSKDSSGEIAHRFEQKDSRFRVVDKENSGYGKTMNIGLGLAKGKYIGIVESDDFVEPDMFSTLYVIAEKYAADVVKSAFWVHTNGFDSFEEIIVEDLYDKVLFPDKNLEVFDRNPSIWSNLYRQDFIETNKIRFFESPGASFQDIAWRVKVFASADRAVFTRQAFYHYRRDNANASVRTEGKLYCVCNEYDEAERFLRQRSDWQEHYQYLLPYLRWGHYNWNCFGRWLSLGSRWEFYQRLHKEFMQYEQDGRLRLKYWSVKGSWLELQRMLTDGRQFFYDRYVSALKKEVLLGGFMSALGEASKLAVYGAGKVGREALAVLCSQGKAPDCFVVTNMTGNDNYVEGLPVRSLEEIETEKLEYVILIAVTVSVQPEILEYLLMKGFRNIVAYLPDFRQVLR